jgi:hypothetical protein
MLVRLVPEAPVVGGPGCTEVVTMARIWSSLLAVPRLVPAAAALALLAACAGPGTQVPTSVSLLIPVYGTDAVRVLTAATAKEITGSGSNLVTTGFDGPCGVARGPDGRVYIASYTDRAIVAIDLAAAVGAGAVTPALVLTSADLFGPCGLAFDGDGDLWVGDYSNGTVLKFENVSGLTGDQSVGPAVMLTVDSSGAFSPFDGIYDIYIDHADRLWVADVYEGIYRFEGIDAFSGATSQVPALQMTRYFDPVVGHYAVDYATSVIVDTSNRLYVGNESHHVARFDGASSLTGYLSDQPANAYISTGYDWALQVTLDEDGALWVAHYGGELVRILTPHTLTGDHDASASLDVDTTYGSGGVDGGRMIFVPTPSVVTGY